MCDLTLTVEDAHSYDLHYGISSVPGYGIHNAFEEQQPRTIRRLTTQIIRCPWKKRILDDLDGGFGIQMFGHLSKGKAVHSGTRISTTRKYVCEGRRTPFD